MRALPATEFLPLLPRQRSVQQAVDCADLMARGLRSDLDALEHARQQGGRLVEPLHHHSFKHSRCRDMRRGAR